MDQPAHVMLSNGVFQPFRQHACLLRNGPSFDGPARLKRLDSLEGFVPDGSGDYLHVLVQLTAPKDRPAMLDQLL
jgi:hypothetical protein